MKILTFTLALLFSINALAQGVPKFPKLSQKIFSQQPITVIDSAHEKPVMVLYENKRTFVKLAKTVTDTVSDKNKYHVLTNRDSIIRYTDSKFVRKVVLIERR